MDANCDDTMPATTIRIRVYKLCEFGVVGLQLLVAPLRTSIILEILTTRELYLFLYGIICNYLSKAKLCSQESHYWIFHNRRTHVNFLRIFANLEEISLLETETCLFCVFRKIGSHRKWPDKSIRFNIL